MRWWLTGLAAWIPGPVRRGLFRPAAVLALVPHGSGLVVLREQGEDHRPLATLEAWPEVERAGLPATARRYRRTVLRLPEAQVMSGTLSLPQATERNLNQVVGFELDRLTPFAQNELYYDCRVLQRQPGDKRIRVVFAAAPRTLVDDWLTRLERLGVRPDRVLVSGNAAPELDLMPRQRRARRGRWRGRARAVTWGAILVLAAANAALPLWQLRAQVIALMPRVDQAQRAAREVAALREEIAALERSASFLGDRKRAVPPVIDVLANLTRVLPDHTWAEQVEIRGREVFVRGVSTQAVNLVPLLEADAMFSAVAFRSPVVADPQVGGERFNLSARLDGGGE